MPITKKSDNIRKFESVGFSHQQAETLADVIEKSHVDSQQDLKSFISEKIDKLELRIKASQTDLLMKIFGIVAGCTTIAIAVVKLLK